VVRRGAIDIVKAVVDCIERRVAMTTMQSKEAVVTGDRYMFIILILYLLLILDVLLIVNDIMASISIKPNGNSE